MNKLIGYNFEGEFMGINGSSIDFVFESHDFKEGDLITYNGDKSLVIQKINNNKVTCRLVGFDLSSYIEIEELEGDKYFVRFPMSLTDIFKGYSVTGIFLKDPTRSTLIELT